LGDAVKFPSAARGGVAMAAGYDPDARELIAQAPAFHCIKLAALGAAADEAGRRERSRHGPVAIGVKHLQKKQEIFHVIHSTVRAEKIAPEPVAEIRFG